MLNKFNQKFGVSGSFKMIELENAIIEKFGSIQYFRYEPIPNTTFDNRPTWDCGTDFEWEDNRLSSECFSCHSREEALMSLCIEHPHEFKDIVKKVYKILKVVK